MRKVPVVTLPKDGPEAATRMMEKNHISSAFVVDSDRYLKGLVRIDDAIKLQKEKKKDLDSILVTDIYTTYSATAIADLMATAMETRYPLAVIDDENRFIGIVDRAAILAEMRSETEDENAPVHFSEHLAEDEQNGSSEKNAEEVGDKIEE
jgi:glycine betaine/proline transport system ATP-binding protein